MAEQSKPDVLLWDLDGTILDSIVVFEAVLKPILPKHDLVMPETAIVRANFHGLLQDCIHSVLGGNLPQTQLAEIHEEFLGTQDVHYEVVEPYIFGDALDLMRRASDAGAEQAIVTNRAHAGHLRASPRSIVENSVLGEYIERVFCADDSEYRKPDPRVLGSYLGEVESRTALVVGDQFVDAEFAHNLGTQAILVARDGTPPPHLERLADGWEAKTRIVRSLAEVAL